MSQCLAGGIPRPRVAALIPVWNAVETLRSATRSLLAQTRPPDDILLVDDGSTDGSRELAETLANEHTTVRVLTTPHRGLVPALNEGLAALEADWILRMDADDLAHRRRVEAQLAAAGQDPQASVVASAVKVFPRRQLAEGFRRYEQWLNSLDTHEAIAREAFIESPVAHPSTMIRRDTLLEVGGWHDVDWAEDYDLWLRLLAAGARFTHVAEPLLLWRDGPTRLTRTDDRYSRLRFLEAKAHYLARGPLAGRQAVVIWGAGRIGGQLARLLEERHGIDVHAFVDIDPGKVGSCRRGRQVVAPPAIPDLAAHPILAAVGRRGARELIRAELDACGRREGEDYWVVA